MLQMKEQGKISEKKKRINLMEVSNLPDIKFKVMVIKMITGLEVRVYELSEYFKKKYRKEPIRLKYTITEINTTLEGINTRLQNVEWLSGLEDRVMKSTQGEQQNKKKKFK